MPDMTARSVVLSVLLGAHPACATAGELVGLAADFGIKETALRVALTRMVGAGDLIDCWPGNAARTTPCARKPGPGAGAG